MCVQEYMYIYMYIQTRACYFVRLAFLLRRMGELCVYINIYICLHVYIYIYIHIHRYRRISIYIYVYMCVYVFTHGRAILHDWHFVAADGRGVCMFMRVYVYIYMFTFLYILIDTD